MARRKPKVAKLRTRTVAPAVVASLATSPAAEQLDAAPAAVAVDAVERRRRILAARRTGNPATVVAVLRELGLHA